MILHMEEQQGKLMGQRNNNVEKKVTECSHE